MEQRAKGKTTWRQWSTKLKAYMNTQGILELKKKSKCAIREKNVTMNYFGLHTISFNIVTTRKFSKDCVLWKCSLCSWAFITNHGCKPIFKLFASWGLVQLSINLNALDYKCLSFFHIIEYFCRIQCQVW